MLLGLVAGVVVLAGKFAADSDWVTNAGIALLVGAVFLATRKRAVTRGTSPACPNCAAGGDDFKTPALHKET